MQCPNCKQYNCISSNKFKDDTYKELMHAGQAGQHAGYPVVAAGALALVGIMKLADRFLVADWRCDRCDWTF